MSIRGDDTLANLEYSAQEVDRALASFMDERARACKAQAEAMKLYDAELLNIMKEVEEDELRSRLSSPARNVDHNILRSINATGDDPDGHKLEIENDSQASLIDFVQSKDSTLGVSNLGIAVKKPPPTQSERLSIRKEMISFFDRSRDSEIDKFNELDVLLGGHNPKKTVDAVEELFLEQTRNFGILMKFLDEYRPEPFVKAWGNDPEYKKITKKYKIAKSDQSFKARATLATLKHKSSRNLGI